MPATHTETGKALWVASRYEIEYKKVAGKWKFATFTSSIYYITPFEEGWAKTRTYG